MAVTSKGRLHDAFVKSLDRRAEQAAAQAAAARGSGLRPWNVPEGGGDPLVVSAVPPGFDRTQIEANFAEVIADATAPGTVGDAISLKVQSDAVAIMERGYRARHCTPVRLLGFSAARRRGHGSTSGVFQGGILGYAQNALKAGQT